MPITTCTVCGQLYEAGSEEQANEPERLCFWCRTVKRNGACRDCGLSTLQLELDSANRCILCARVWREKMKELGGSE